MRHSISIVGCLAALLVAPVVAGAAPTRNLDLLFVIDDSAEMYGPQRRLAAALTGFLAALEELDGGLPDVHIGVISSAMDVGESSAECPANGDGGQLQHTPLGIGCDIGLSNAYLSDIAGPDGSRTRNYGGTLATNLGCMVQLGEGGCGFEQHLASLRTALDGTVAANDGFLRDDAVLAVIVLADEDDCSAIDPFLFASSDAALAMFGPRVSFRCTRAGVTCTPAIDDTLGPRSDCVPTADSDYVLDPQDIVDFLVSLKGAERVVFGLLAGDPAPVAVGEYFGTALLPSCTRKADGSVGFPAVRLGWVADHLPRHVRASICAEAEPPLLDMVDQIGAALRADPLDPDAGPDGADAGVDGADGGAAGDGGTAVNGGDGGCGCSADRAGGRGAIATLLLIALATAAALRRRSEPRRVDRSMTLAAPRELPPRGSLRSPPPLHGSGSQPAVGGYSGIGSGTCAVSQSSRYFERT